MGALDPEAIAEVVEESWPVVRDADELHDALLTLIVLPPVAEWRITTVYLNAARRAGHMTVDGRELWVPAERLDLALGRLPGARRRTRVWSRRRHPEPAPGTPRNASRKSCAAGWSPPGRVRSRPSPSSSRSSRCAVEAALARLEGEGQVLRGHFRSTDKDSEMEWCNRRLLARIHRLTMGRLRREIEPVTTADFMRFLFRWQHLRVGAQLHGVDGAFQVIRQLQGYEIPAAAWESEILPRRIAQYGPELLDQFCLSGEVMWGRLSPHPAFEREGRGASGRRESRPSPSSFAKMPTGCSRVADGDTRALSHPAREVLEALEKRGASFFARTGPRHTAAGERSGRRACGSWSRRAW